MNSNNETDGGHNTSFTLFFSILWLFYESDWHRTPVICLPLFFNHHHWHLQAVSRYWERGFTSTLKTSKVTAGCGRKKPGRCCAVTRWELFSWGGVTRRGRSGRSCDFRPLKQKPRGSPRLSLRGSCVYEGQRYTELDSDSVSPANCENTHYVW